MKCRLCLLEKPLIKKAHIIPSFLHKDLFNNSSSMLRLNAGSGKSFPVFTGEFEKDILCKNCDNNIIGNNETYASGRLSEIITNIDYKLGEHQPLLIEGLDYKKMKLFFLSLLWRSSISSRDFFYNVSLGSHEEEVRQMLAGGDPGRPDKYPCMISSYRNSSLPKDIVCSVGRVKFEDATRGYAFIFI